MDCFREDHLLMFKREDPYELILHFSTQIDDIISFKDEVDLFFKLYRENYENLDSMIECLFDAAKPAIECGEQRQLDEHYRFTDEKFSYKTVTPKSIMLSCPAGVGKECCDTRFIIHKLSVSYPENDDFVQVHIHAKNDISL